MVVAGLQQRGALGFHADDTLLSRNCEVLEYACDKRSTLDIINTAHSLEKCSIDGVSKAVQATKDYANFLFALLYFIQPFVNFPLAE